MHDAWISGCIGRLVLAIIASLALWVGADAGDFVGIGIGNGTSCRIVDAATGALREHRVLLFVDWHLSEIALNWLVNYDVTCRGDSLQHVEIVCMDKAVHAIMESLGHACSSSSFELSSSRTSRSRHLPSSFELLRRKNSSREVRMGSIWLKRVEIIASYLDRGLDVVLSDADAIWLQGGSLFHDMSRYGMNNSLIVSRAWWPHELYTRWGATACLGFGYFRAGDDGFSASFFRSMLQQLRSSAESKQGQIPQIPDDQVAFNTQLSAMGVSWLTNLTVLGNTHSDHGSLAWGGSFRGVLLLPHHHYPRKCHSESGGFVGSVSRKERRQVASTVKDARVAHCRLSKGETHAKKVRLSAYGLWRLSPQWRKDLGSFKDKLSLPNMLRVIQHGAAHAARIHNFTLVITNITLPQ